MRILHVFKTYRPDTQGGLEEAIRQICLNTRPYGMEHIVLTMTRARAEPVVELPEARVIRVPTLFDVMSTPFGPAVFKQFRASAAAADLIHYHMPWPLCDLLHLCSHVSRPSIATYHSDVLRGKGLKHLYAPLMRRFLSALDRVVVTSESYLRTSAELSRCLSKCEVIPLGLDEGSYPPVGAAERALWRERLGEGFFLFVGVLRYYKGLRFLIEAARDTAHRVVIVGKGPLERELKRQAQGMQNVHFTGYVPDPDKVALLELCRAVVLPSHLRAEAFGLSLVEGTMFGKPLISTELGTGTSLVNRDGVTGLVVPPGQPARLREAMDRLTTDQEGVRRMGQAARRRFDELFRAQVMGQKYAGLYRRIAAGPEPAAIPGHAHG